MSKQVPYNVISVEQGTEEWLEWRKNGICASDVAVIKGISPFGEPYDIYAAKVENEEKYVTPAMRRGTQYEAEAREIAKEVFFTDFTPLCLESTLDPIQRASLDGWASSMVLEIKVPSAKNFQNTRDKGVPAHYEAQIQWQLAVAGLSLGILFYYFPENKDFTYHFVHADKSYQNDLYQAAREFWENHIVALDPPEKRTPFVEDPMLEFYTKEYVEKCRRIKELKEETDDLKKRIEEVAPSSNWKNDYVTYFKRTSSGYDYDAMKKDGIDIEKYRKEGNVSTVIRPLKKE